jgi:hemin uptake protein HemP
MPSNPSDVSGSDPQSEAEAQTPATSYAKNRHPVGTTRISSQALFSGANEVEIEHKGALYRLRQTSLGKLILTK